MNLSALKEEPPTPELVRIVDSLFDDSISISSQKGIDRYVAVKEVTRELATPKTKIPQLSDLQAQFVEEVLKTTKASPRYCYLWASLTSNMKFNLLRCLLEGDSKNTLPTHRDWVNIFRPIKYQFETSWHFRFILALLGIISIISLGEMANIVFHSSTLFRWENGFLLIITGPIIGSFYLLWISKKWRGDLAEALLDRGWMIISIFLTPFAAIVYPFILIIRIWNKVLESDEIQGVLFVYWFPAVAYFTVLTLLQVFTLPYVILIWLIIWLSLLVVSGLLMWFAQKRDREARNPLQGILEAKASSTSSKYLVSKSLFRLRGLRL
jgi:hypothetical protein